MQIKEIMTSPAVTVNASDSILAAAEHMKAHNIGVLPVVENKKPIGIVTDRDIIIRAVAQDWDAKTHAVNEIMTHNVDTVSPSEDVCDATCKMAKDKVRRLPVVEGETIVGMVTLGDVASCHCYDEEISNTLTDISCNYRGNCK